MIHCVYSLLGEAIHPLLRHWLNKRTKRGKEDAARLQERFGHASFPRPHGILIWLHAASVGEAQSVLTLVRQIVQQSPETHLLVTTGTVTSAALIAQHAFPQMIHQYIPVDTLSSVKRFLNHWKPDLALWVESELWPQLVWQTHGRGIPMLLINGRMSERSFAGWKKWPRTIRRILNCFHSVYAGSPLDAAHFRALGDAKVIEAGNLKYDAAQLPTDPAAFARLSAQTAERRVWVAASTHEGEEEIMARVQRDAAQYMRELLCLLVPRHAHRGDAIAAQLRAQGFQVAQRSKDESISSSTDIYLADTMGELGHFYRLADLVILGGSFVSVGGHNPLEPARFSTAIITGSHIHNFADIMQDFEQQHAICIVENETGLKEKTIALLADDAQRLEMAERALALVTHAAGATQRIVEHVLMLLQEQRHAHA